VRRFWHVTMIVFAVLITLIFNSNIIYANDCQYPTSDGIFDLRTFGYSNRPKYTNIVDSRGNQIEYSYNGCFSYKTKDNCKNAAACISKSIRFNLISRSLSSI
jgi:hypothetical protein